jgi:hypothetical protein
MATERDNRRFMYLQALDERSHEDPYAHWEPQDLVENYTEPQIQDALQYLEEKRFIEVNHSLGDRGLSDARITAHGQDFLSNAQSFTTDRALGSLAQAAVTYNTTHITNSTVGNLASGGTGHTFSGAVTITNHPQADALRDAFHAFDAALAQDTTLDSDEKDEIAQQVETVRKELAKPTNEQDKKKIGRRWDRVTTLVAFTAPVLEIGVTISKLLLLPHGS